jgi:uncharacterized radical SAM protein YgiQ
MPFKKYINLNALPVTKAEIYEFGWNEIDIILVTGDAYIDHPSFGIAIIGKILAQQGYKTAILSQPRHENCEDFKRFGKPRLFFGITAGNLDSIISNYSGNARIREVDSYSPYGNPYFDSKREKKYRIRPDRATIRYSQLAREAYPDAPIILGGIEASLRRFVHYDFQQEKLRGSVLEDSKADLLVYGMGESQVIEIAKRCEAKQTLSGIPGTCELITNPDAFEKNNEDIFIMPSYNAIIEKKENFLIAELIIEQNSQSIKPKTLIQKQKTRFIKQNSPNLVLNSDELNKIYELPFTYAPHPFFNNIPAWNMIQNSITSVRGCSGNCSFCSITRHQGNIVVSRDIDSILRETEKITKLSYFKGTINDIGGPTANLYGTSCKIGNKCGRKDCLNPEPCKNLDFNPDKFINLLQTLRETTNIKHIFVSSGLRYDLLLRTPLLLEELLLFHTPGRLKVAPENLSDNVLRLMHKTNSDIFKDFIRLTRIISNKNNKKSAILPYYISSHPGSTIENMKFTASESIKIGIKSCSLQDFTPSPGSISTAMYFSGLDRDNKKEIFVAKTRTQKREQREITEKYLKIF